MKGAIKAGEFREDLFYRLNVVNIHLPPLRERKDDIPLLAAHFIGIQNGKFKTQIKGLAPDALEAAVEYAWPGNIRQLRNVIEACIAMENNDCITLPVLSQFIEVPVATEAEGEAFPDEGEYTKALTRFETDYLIGLLRKNHGNVEAAAKEAGTNMATIYRKIKKYGIRKDEYNA
jgi:transcriptional regulator with PAS, ATPase and Fis domain